MQLQINATTRPPANNRALRRGGQIPATVYGHKGAESISITLDGREATTLLRQATINNTMIEVNVTDGDFKGKTLLREVQNHPYKKEIYHLSFFAIESQSKIEVDIPLHFVGVPVGVKVGGGMIAFSVEANLGQSRPLRRVRRFEFTIQKRGQLAVHGHPEFRFTNQIE